MLQYYDLEFELISRLTNAFNLLGENIFVSNEKPSKDTNPYPEKIVTVRTDGGYELNNLIRKESIGVNVFTPERAESARIALLVEAILKNMADAVIKRVEIKLSSTRVKDDTTSERRYLTAEVTTKATQI